MTPDQFPNSGLNTASPHPPVYYTATALGGEAFEAVPGVDSPITGARLVGILWLGAAAVVLWYVLGSLGASSWIKALLIGLLAVSPTVLHESSIINPDTTALLGGALVLAAALRWDGGRAPSWLLPLAALVAVWLKFTNSVAVGAAVVYLAVRAWQRRDDLTTRTIRNWSLMTVQRSSWTVASIITWSAVQDAEATSMRSSCPLMPFTKLTASNGSAWATSSSPPSARCAAHSCPTPSPEASWSHWGAS